MDVGWTVRELHDDADIERLQRLIESDPGFAERTTGLPPGASDALSALIARPEGLDAGDKFGWGLFDGDDLLAFCDVLRGYPDPSTAWIGLLLVEPSVRRCGAGRFLHEEALRRIRRRGGISRVMLGVIESNAGQAQPFWRALGYRPTGRPRPYRYANLTSTVTRWSLALA